MREILTAPSVEMASISTKVIDLQAAQFEYKNQLKTQQSQPINATSLGSDELVIPAATTCTRSVVELLASRLKKVNSQLLHEDDDAEDSFFVADMGDVVRQFDRWISLLPRIEPFFAMKCQPDPQVIRTVASMGAGFDCASKHEIKMALAAGVPASSIIYANPCKSSSHIRFAASKGVRMMTFDNTEELVKIRACHPNPQLVLRIATDDSQSICRFSVKFGASMEDAKRLLHEAKELDLEIIGVSFHVGSGCCSPHSYTLALTSARALFDYGATLGHVMTLLDVGGGFPGSSASYTKGLEFSDVAKVLAQEVDRLFPREEGVRVIAEPGRYFVSGAFSLAVNVHARRTVKNVGEEDSYMYYVTDGMYGSFNCITFDHASPQPEILMRNGNFVYDPRNDSPNAGEELRKCSIWGPTCDSIDCILKQGQLPVLNVGDWLVFEGMGAYTSAAASQFNGFKRSTMIYTNTEFSRFVALSAASGRQDPHFTD